MRTISMLGLLVVVGCSSAPEALPDGVTPADAAATKEASALPEASLPEASLPDVSSPTPTQTLFGAAFNPHDDARFTTLSGSWSGMQVIRSYDNGSGVTPFLKSLQADDLGWQAVSAYSFKYDPASVIAGTHDADLKSFFQGIQDNHPVYWTYYHEPDDQIYKDHTFTAPDYRAAWAHIRGIFDAVKAQRPNLIAYATFICMEYSMTAPIAPSRPLTGANGMYPGDDVIDIFGVDAYNEAANKGGITDAATQFGGVIDFAQAHGKGWAIGELGSCDVPNESQGRATYLTKAIQYWKSRNALPAYVAYFDVDMTPSGGCDFRFDSDTAANAVWKQAVTKGAASF